MKKHPISTKTLCLSLSVGTLTLQACMQEEVANATFSQVNLHSPEDLDHISVISWRDLPLPNARTELPQPAASARYLRYIKYCVAFCWGLFVICASGGAGWLFYSAFQERPESVLLQAAPNVACIKALPYGCIATQTSIEPYRIKKKRLMKSKRRFYSGPMHHQLAQSLCIGELTYTDPDGNNLAHLANLCNSRGAIATITDPAFRQVICQGTQRPIPWKVLYDAPNHKGQTPFDVQPVSIQTKKSISSCGELLGLTQVAWYRTCAAWWARICGLWE